MGKRITRELLKKRAEHNDGDLATLQEVTLHQYDIEKIEGLEENCRDLEIVFLQNNQIGRIENVGKLKGLRYLQLALNNIRHIENLQHNEALEKLDLTVNFVENPLDLENLKDNYRLRELYLVGNPVNKLDGYRAFAIHTLPQLRVLDGVEITRTERLEAAQQYEALRAAYVETYKAPAAGGRHVPVEDMDASDAHTTASAETDTAAAATDPQAFQSEVVPHTPSARLKVARDLEALRQRDAA
ncbi:outer arm dynein light chain 1, partial [Caulochytrium protostelioides]